LKTKEEEQTTLMLRYQFLLDKNHNYLIEYQESRFSNNMSIIALILVLYMITDWFPQ